LVGGACQSPSHRASHSRDPCALLGSMRAALFIEPHHVEPGDRRDPVIVEPSDAIVRVVLACVCGSDLWY